MHKSILLFCFSLPVACDAQSHKVDFGLSASAFVRQAQTTTNPFSHLFGAMGVDGVLRIGGTEETDMSFVMNAGIADDIRKYNVSVDYKVRNSIYLLNINPSVVIPSKWQHIQFILGIGTFVRLGEDVSFSWGSSVPGGGTTTDSMNRLLRTNARNIIPYVSLGLAGDVSRHTRLAFTIQPALLNFYESDTKLQFTYTTGTSSGGSLVELNYRPIYVGLRLFYFFKGV
jgi:hypothetical protein